MQWNNLELPEQNIYFKDDDTVIYCADCRSVNLSGISAVVTDPPYELGFMGKSWDSQGVSFKSGTWEKIRSYCLSGSPLLSFGGSRTQHRIACAIEDAGWEIRDTLMWVYGSGFPKSLNIGKAVDKLQGNERTKIPTTGGLHKNNNLNDDNWTKIGQDTPVMDSNIPVSKDAQLWNGYGTALKPAYEPIILGMNPLDGTFANNALKHGVAGLNIEGCRIPLNGDKKTSGGCGGNTNPVNINLVNNPKEDNSQGRFPANFLHDGSEEVMELFPETNTHGGGTTKTRGIAFSPVNKQRREPYPVPTGDSGSAARFFYCAKASKAERDKGCEELPQINNMRVNAPRDSEEDKFNSKLGNNHPTVKPLALMEYLVKLVKMPEYNLILDPFMGSGTTLMACKKLGVKAIGIELDEHSCEIAVKRIASVERLRQSVVWRLDLI